MFLARVSCGLLLLFVYVQQSASQITDDSILTRPSDESARTREERQQALTVLLEAARRSQDAEPAKAARFLNRIARLQVLLNSSKDARASYQTALNLLERSPDPAIKIDTLNGLASLNLQSSLCGEAQSLSNQAIRLSKQFKNIAGEAEALLTLGDCQNLRRQKLAWQNVRRSLELWQSIEDKKGIARAYGLLSDLQLVQNNLADATRSNEVALNIWRELDLPAEQAGALINLGFIEYRKGSWQDCLSYLTQAQSLLDEKSEPFRMAQINAGIAEAFMESGIPEAGLTKAKEALEYYRRAEDPRGMVASSWDIGKAYYLLGDYSTAIASLEQTRRDAEANGLPRITAFCHDFLGRTYSATGDRDRAQTEFQRALEIYTQLENPREAARTRVLIGHVYVQRGMLDQARQYFQAALVTFDRLSDQVNQAVALHALGKLELKLNHLDLAETYLKKSIDVTENLRRISTTGDLMTAVSATVYDRYESYIDCLMLKHQNQPSKGYDVRAFETSELARSRALVDLLRASQTNLVAGLDPQLSAQEKSLRQSLQVKENARLALLEKPYKKEELKALDADQAELEAEYTKLLDSIRAQYPAFEQITRPTAMPIEQVQAQILGDDKNLLLEYSLGDERSYLWLVSRNEFSSYQLPGRNEINELAQKLHGLLSKLPSTPAESVDAELSTEISELSRVLLAPVENKLADKRLIIVADGALQLIPFQTLETPYHSTTDANGETRPAPRPLVLDHEIVNEPSASTLALLLHESANRKRATGSVAILADPVFESDDPRIPTHGTTLSQTTPQTSIVDQLSATTRDLEKDTDGGHIPRLLASRDEADAIMKVVPWRTAFKALDFEASRATVSMPTLAQHSIVHFATHARLNNQHPEFSGIVLSLFNAQGLPQDGYLRMTDIYGLKLPVDLVVLSACQTGLGKEVRGEGLISLTRAFMYAGAGGVTASLWKVDDEATAELMERFYAGMFSRGSTPAAALREAQLSMWHEKRWHAPYFWAAFVIQGQYNQKEMAPRDSKWIWYGPSIAGFVIVCVAAFLYWRKRRRPIVRLQ